MHIGAEGKGLLTRTEYAQTPLGEELLELVNMGALVLVCLTAAAGIWWTYNQASALPRIQIQAALLELLHHRHQLIACLFVSKLTNRLHSGPSLIAMTAPSDTRTRSLVPRGASAVVRSTAASPVSGAVWTTA